MGSRVIVKALNLLCRESWNNFKNNLRRIKFNLETKNHIGSALVNLNSIKGREITVMTGAYICPASSVDSFTFIGFNTLISKTSIGRYTSIASNVNIGQGEHPIDQISTSAFFIDDPLKTFTKDHCIIENDVWIGVGSTIRRGVKIGTGAIVGANSFVNKDVPPYAIVIGCPARILRYRFSQEKIQKILSSKWWDLDLQEAKKVIVETENLD